MPDTISGLPLHPLIVHFAVVLLPLSALGLLVILAVPRWRRPYGWIVLAGLLASAGFAFIAKETGESLAATLGLPQEHAQWGDRIVPIAGLLLIAAAIWFWQVNRGATGVLTTVTAIASAILAVISIVVIVIVGHTGAQAAWAGKMAAVASLDATGGPSAAPSSNAAPMASSAPATSPTSGSTGGAKASITMAEVRTHSSPSDCWTVVDAKVYDLTDWIAQHPGGQSPIERMCGKDATEAFSAQHGGQQRPERVLKRYKIGTLA